MLAASALDGPSVARRQPRPAGVRIAGATLRRGPTTVFDGLDLELSEMRVGLIGDNGAGKTTLFRLICGLERPQAGQVRVFGAVAGTTRAVGMMFQSPDDQIVFPTVEEELALGLAPSGGSRRAALEQARAFLAQRGRQAWAARPVGSLSHGQRQYLCWLALRLAGHRILLLDEPYASLDIPGQIRLRAEIEAAGQDVQVVVSTHTLEHVRDFERVIWLEGGRIREDGPGAQVCARYDACARAGHAG